MRFFLATSVSLSLFSLSLGFQTSPLQRASLQRKSTSSSLAVVPIEHLNDVHSILTHSPAWSFLADASSATVDPDSGLLQGAIDFVQSNSDDKVAENVIAELEMAKDEGIWRAYLNIFKEALNTIHDKIDGPLRAQGITQTWGVSIALFTASFRTLLLPLSLQQTKGTEYMKALKPYQNQIKKKFKDNKEQQNRATAKLFEDAEQNPLAGCLISIAQLPVLLGLYRGIRLLAIDGKLDEPFLWIPSLEGPVTAETDFRGLDWLTSGWVDGVPSLGWETTLAFLVMPCLLVIGQSLTMNVLTPPVDDDLAQEEKEQMEKTQGALKFLPLLIGFFSLQVPAGLTIYWFTTNVFTLSSTLAARTYYKVNPPKIELPDYWDAIENIDDLSADEKRKAAKAGLSVGPSFASMLEEAKFHNIVERKALRQTLPASMDIPPEMESWVGPRMAQQAVEAEATA